MFEARFPQQVTAFAAHSEAFQKVMAAMAIKLVKHFDPNHP